MNYIALLFGALKEMFGWKRDREARRNAPEMRKNEEARRDAGLSSSANATVEKAHETHNLDELRKEAGE